MNVSAGRPFFTRRHFVGRGLTLATAFRLRGAARSLGFAADANVCKLSAEQTIGPYYIADELFRSNIRENRQGIALTLRIALLDSRTCKPLPNAAIDVWHCDALGIYSGFTKENPTGGPGGMGPGGHPPGPPPGRSADGRPPGPPPGFDPEHPGNHPGPPEGMGGPPMMNKPTDKLTFLRGIQLTDEKGMVEFETIFPGFYMGRTNHIHFQARLGGKQADHTYKAGHTSHIGQIFFSEELTKQLMALPPYVNHKIQRTTQAEDDIFTDQHGSFSIAHMRAADPKNPSAGFRGELIAAVDPTATPAPEGMGGPGGPGGPRRRPNGSTQAQPDQR